MSVRLGQMLLVLFLLLAFPVLSQAQSVGGSPVSVPDGTKVSAIKLGDEQTVVNLQPAEQVAFLFVYALWGLEEKCLEKDSGLGRLCSLSELVKGVKLQSDETIGLSVDPAKDTNYRYDVMAIGEDCVIRALPSVRGLGGFAMVGSPKGFGSKMYFNPKGPDMRQATKITEMGYEGNGFRR